MNSFQIRSVTYCAIALALGVSCYGLLAGLKQEPPQQTPKPKSFNVEVYDVQPADLQEVIVGFGTVRAEHDVEVSAQVAGQIASISQLLKVGEKVTGPPIDSTDAAAESLATVIDDLISIDGKVYAERRSAAGTAIAEAQAQQATLQQEEANNQKLLTKTNSDYKIASREHAKMVELQADGSITESQLAKSELDLQRYEQSKIQVENTHDLFPKRRNQLTRQIERLQSELQLATIDVDRTIVRPPFPGVLSEVWAEKGKYVMVGDPLFRITNIDTVEIAVPLHNSDFAKIALLVVANQQPVVRLAENESSEVRWVGKVVRVAPEANRTTRTLSVFVEVDNTQQSLPLLPGSFVQARIDGPILQDQFVVPREAVLGFERSRGSVVLAANESTKRRSIVISRRLEGLAIVEGLKAGDKVVMSNLDVINDQSKIQVLQTHTLADEIAAQFTVRIAPKRD